jgi:hypothetical protein
MLELGTQVTVFAEKLRWTCLASDVKILSDLEEVIAAETGRVVAPCISRGGSPYERRAEGGKGLYTWLYIALANLALPLVRGVLEGALLLLRILPDERLAARLAYPSVALASARICGFCRRVRVSAGKRISTHTLAKAEYRFLSEGTRFSTIFHRSPDLSTKSDISICIT